MITQKITWKLRSETAINNCKTNRWLLQKKPFVLKLENTGGGGGYSHVCVVTGVTLTLRMPCFLMFLKPSHAPLTHLTASIKASNPVSAKQANQTLCTDKHHFGGFEHFSRGQVNWRHFPSELTS